MIPREPSRGPQLGFLYIPPYRIQGISIAGEQSFVQVPELDVCFDIGTAPRTALTSNYVALTHGHMDHAAGIAYYFSQRQFQGMGTGNIVCPPEVKPAIQNIMEAWSGLEGQRTPFNVIPLGHEQEFQIKNGIDLRAFTTQHTVPSVGYVVVEKRSKLLPELQGMEQEQIMAIKASGRPITHVLQIPLVCYTGDTYWGSHFQRDDVLKARILITECTFLETGHRKRAAVGKHLHVDNIETCARPARPRPSCSRTSPAAHTWARPANCSNGSSPPATATACTSSWTAAPTNAATNANSKRPRPRAAQPRTRSAVGRHPWSRFLTGSTGWAGLTG